MDHTTEQLEKRLHALIYQHGLKHFIKLLETQDDMYQRPTVISSTNPSDEMEEVINLNEISSNAAITKEPSEPATPEPSQVEMTPEYLAMLIQETYTNVVQFANDYSNIFIAPYDELTTEEVDMLVQLNNASSIKSWIENHLSTPDYKFPDVLNFDNFNSKTTTSGLTSYNHLYDDLYILMNENVIVYKNKHQYSDKTGRFLGALELCLDLSNLIMKDHPSHTSIPVDQSDHYEEMDVYIQTHPHEDLCTYMTQLVKDISQLPPDDPHLSILIHLAKMEFYRSSLGEQMFILEFLKIFTADEIMQLTIDDLDIYRRYYQYKICDYTKIPVKEVTYATYFSSHIPRFYNLEKVKRVLRHWSTIERTPEANLLPLVCP